MPMSDLVPLPLPTPPAASAPVTTLNISPGATLGPLVLGLSVNDTFALVARELPAPSVFLYSEANPLQFDFFLDVARLGVRLRFDSPSQRLKVIAVRTAQDLTLAYRKTVFSSPKLPATLKSIIDLFGPTTPGRLAGDVYELVYPGLAMHFAVHAGKDHVPRVRGEHDLAAATLARVFIFRGDDYRQPRVLHSPPLKDAQNRRGSFSTRGVDSVLSGPRPSAVRFHQGISSVQNGLDADADDVEDLEDHVRVRVDTAGVVHFSALGQTLSFGAHAQDVMSVLGNPEDIFVKERDHMAIHRGADMDDPFVSDIGRGGGGGGDGSDLGEEALEAPEADYFYNYFRAGLDVLFDGRTHRAKKFVFHCNFPGHADFNVYHKCQFRLELPTERELLRPVEEPAERELVGDLLGQPEFAPAKRVVRKKRVIHEKVVVSPDSRWEDIKRKLGVTAAVPVILGLPSHVNPFGATSAFGHWNCVFEVMKNGHVASVTLFDTAE